ncbi:M28 family metallopeptidase [Terrimonas sp. NA20]|uniref:M28 family metallopeptidase n=1 Tax=Terrimonas ginsenosidimutans TaxID=2908004 RepID=A0ABS9KL49_9BACT|nr:M28 family metallopeptidase [Terrimonas ginsenosidimutans]MCG2613044.1 M28 family metallopeptidase [Terrimonas ginsenosidimutans]
MRRYILPACIAVAALSSCGETKTAADEQDGFAAFNVDSLKKDISILASDEFQGRKPFSAGETKTIDFLKTQFAAAGLEPGNGDSYIQDVPMVKITTAAAPTMAVEGPKGKFNLKGFDDYVIWTDKTDPSISLDKAELVFAGYGVVAPEYNWNDYAGLDVKGKVVLVLVNDPGYNAQDSSLFKGSTMTYYGRWTYKFEEAARQGAKGCLIVHNTAGASYPFTVVQNNWNGSRLRLDNRGKDETLCDVIGWVSAPAAKQLLAAAGTDSSILTLADKKGYKGGSLGLKLSTTMKVATEYNMSHNVIGKISGSKHPDEVIIYSAHWDHLGIGKPDETGDSIYNGALDNASATAGLLELARAFKSLKTKPERTVVFLAVTAEEQGLWGSAYYAQNPVYPTAKTLANINMDGLNSYGKTKDIIVIGRDQNQLEDYLKEEAGKSGREISYETHPEAGYYYRSDHFNFAKVGIPALYTESGVDVIGKGKAFGEAKKDEYTEKNYHRPSDEYTPENWVLDGAIDDLKLFFQVGKKLASDEKWPEWKSGSEFKALREKDLKKQ